MRILSLFLFVLLLPQLCLAQSFSSEIANPKPTLEVEPLYPSPDERVTINFNDFRSGTIGSEIKWFYNGSLVPDAQNKRTVELTAPAAGTIATIKMQVVTSGQTETFTTTLKPVYLDIIIEPQTHVPEFYVGRALPSIGSQVNATALLSNGKGLGTGYIYTWRINDTVYEGGGLRGQNSIVFSMPQGSNTTLSLQVATYTGVVIAKRTLFVPSVKPELYFYEVNSLYGISTKAITNDFNFISNSATVRTEPYYLDSQVFNYPDVLEWTLDGSAVSPDNQNPYEVTLERTGYPGDTTLGFHIRSTTQLLQGVKGALGINI